MVEEEKQTKISQPDFSKLSLGTLRKYQSFFNLKIESKSNTQLIESVGNHFTEIEINTDDVLEKFIKIEKDQVQDLGLSNPRKSMRYQEKLEKTKYNRIIEYVKNNNSSS